MDLLKQLIPSDICLKCDVCCRFSDPESDRIPFFLPEERERLSPKERATTPILSISSEDGRCRCPFFEPQTHECRIYGYRPLDCQLYPFLLLWNPSHSRVVLGLDTQCPFVQDLTQTQNLLAYAEEVRFFLENKEQVQRLAKNPGIIGEPQEETFLLTPLPCLTESLCRLRPPRDKELLELGLRPLRIEDKLYLDRFWTDSGPVPLSSHAFATLVLFQDILPCYWKESQETLLVIAEQGGKSFLLLPPLGKNIEPALSEAIQLLKQLNGDRFPLQIENIPEDQAGFYERLGFKLIQKDPDYIYLREALVDLKGDSYKSKRSSYNYFVTHYPFSHLPYEDSLFNEGLLLFNRWAASRRQTLKDPFALALLEDSFFVHHRLLRHASALGLTGRVVRIAGELKAYTFGFALDEETFCVVAEIADPAVKGLPQFLFREFCREKASFLYINAMDDSGLESLRRVKDSYRPFLKKIPYAAAR